MGTKRVERGIYDRDGVLYILYINERGETVWLSTRQATVKVARQILAKKKTEVAEARNLPNKRYEKVRFSDLADNWWNREGSRKSHGWKYLIPRVRERFGRMKAREVTSDLVQDFLEDLRETLSPSSCNHFRSMIRSIFKFAVERDQYDRNPVVAVPTFHEPPGRERFPTPDEIRALLAALAHKPDILAAVIVLATTTLRKCEVLHRPWSDVRLDESVPYICVPRSKNGNMKKVPIPAQAATALRSLPSYGKSEWVFPSRATARWRNPKAPYRWDIGKEFREACRNAGLKDLRVHDLRHMGASILTELGTPAEIIRKITGHRSRELDRYQHLSDGLKRRTVDLIAAAIFDTEGPTTVQ